MKFPLLNNRFTFWEKKTNKKYSLYGYWTSTESKYYPPVRKMCPIPNPPLTGEHIIIFSNKTFYVPIFRKYTLLNLILSNFGKYLEPRKECTRFAWSKPVQKCWTGVIFGDFIMIFLD